MDLRIYWNKKNNTSDLKMSGDAISWNSIYYSQSYEFLKITQKCVKVVLVQHLEIPMNWYFQISIYLLILAVELENIQFLQIFRNNEIREVWSHDIPTVLIRQDFGKTFWI